MTKLSGLVFLFYAILINADSTSIPYEEIGKNVVIAEDRCTTIVVGGKAGVDGPMTTHTSDCSNCDFRLDLLDRFISIWLYSI